MARYINELPNFTEFPVWFEQDHLQTDQKRKSHPLFFFSLLSRLAVLTCGGALYKDRWIAHGKTSDVHDNSLTSWPRNIKTSASFFSLQKEKRVPSSRHNKRYFCRCEGVTGSSFLSVWLIPFLRYPLEFMAEATFWNTAKCPWMLQRDDRDVAWNNKRREKKGAFEFI